MNTQRHRIAPKATSRARELRRAAPVPERLLWARLRDSQLGGLRFRRQYPVGPFVADFYCPAARLVIELDGMSHRDRAVYDEQRTAYLSSMGLGVIRFTDDEVMRHLDDVVRAIAKAAGVELGTV